MMDPEVGRELDASDASALRGGRSYDWGLGGICVWESF